MLLFKFFFKDFKKMLSIKNFFNANANVGINVQVDDPQSYTYVILNHNDNLSNVRKVLEGNSNVKMNDSLLFAIKTNDFAKIAKEDEENMILNDIIKEDNVLYLRKNSKYNWKILNNLNKLDYGRTITFDGIKKANKRAFEMKECKMTEIGAEGCRKGKIEFNSEEDWMMKTNLFFTSDVNVENFVKLGISIGKSSNKNFKLEINSSYDYIKYSKVSLKFEKLEPTKEFINAVKDAIESSDPEKFKQITEEFGQFISNEVFLGGRAHFESIKRSEKSSAENSSEAAIKVSKINIGKNSKDTKGKTDSYQLECTKLVGGQQPPSLKKFDEMSWIESLKDYINWRCIEFKDPINIFQLLPKDLQAKIFKTLGKKVLYSKIENFNYNLKEFGRPKVFELNINDNNISSNISKIIQNKDADCNFFATVIDAKEVKNDIFNCQILYPPGAKKPRLIIHCIQNKFKERECKLKIGWMVIGYDINFNLFHQDFNIQLNIYKKDLSIQSLDYKEEFFNLEDNSLIKKIPCFGIPVLSKLDSSNISLVIGHHFFSKENTIGSYTFSYCLKNKHYVNLPNFTFCTLIISNHPNPDASGISYFECNNNMIRNLITKSSTECDPLKPKYISLYSTGENNCGPVFLKQKSKEVKIKYVNVSCNKVDCICKNGTLKKINNLEYAFFDPNPGIPLFQPFNLFINYYYTLLCTKQMFLFNY